MNKVEFIQKLKSETGLEDSQCDVINGILEDHFIIGRKNKEKIIDDLIVELNIEKEQAEKIYELAMSIVAEEIKDKLKHPFKSQD